jgi:Ca-activated chloride channel family protein
MGLPSLDTNPIDQRPLHTASAPDIDFAKLAGATINIPLNLDDDFDYAVYTFEPKPETGIFGSRDDDPRGYFRVDITAKRSLRKLPAMPKDVVFLIDVSGSVSQMWVDQVIRGVSDALGSLNPGDRFNIVFFQEKPALFSAEAIRPFNEQSLAEARAFLTSARSGGYTDVNRALSRLLVRDLEKQRVYNLVLISDGVPTRGVMDTRELINLITRDNDLAASIYCIGVGDKQNRQLLDFLAYRNKGFCQYAEEIGQAANTIRELGSRLRYPILKDIRFNAVGVADGDLFPVDLPNLHQGETFSLFGRFSQRGSFTMRLTGLNAQQACDFTFTRDLNQAQPLDKALAEQWAFWKLHHLYSEVIRHGETAELKAAIEALRKKYRLKTLY